VRDHLPVHWIVDGNNVMGSRPDGWWRDRGRAARALAAQVAAFAQDTGEPVTLFFDGRPRDLGLPRDTPLETFFAHRPGRDAADHAIAEYVEAMSDPTAIRVVTSDRELAARVQATGAQVEGAGRFRARLDAL
jgi:predicted RNA-binding protein with PIN domain